jgi:hypothetical protein
MDISDRNHPEQALRESEAHILFGLVPKVSSEPSQQPPGG